MDITPIRDQDRDALSVLPLAIIPLETKVLREYRMVKNAQLEGVVELFNDQQAGKGHIHPRDLRNDFPSVTPADQKIITNLSELYSYDVYSLRISLREMGINVNASAHLKLSEHKQAELSIYMKPFIKRLILQIFGNNSEVDVSSDLTSLLRNPDTQLVRQHLSAISDKLSIGLQDVPLFLEEYGDIYLSIAYYRQCLEAIAPMVENFVYCTQKILENNQLRQNAELAKTTLRLQKKVLKLRTVLRERFDVFAQSTNDMWQDMSAESFGVFKKLVEDNHAALGGLLCTLSIKMHSWSDKFPTTSSAGPVRWADYIMTDIRQGF